MEEQKQSKTGKKSPNLFSIQHLQTLRNESGLTFPYHPLITTIDIHKSLYLATKQRDTIGIFIFNNKQLQRTYTLNLDSMPRSSISALQFIPTQLLQTITKNDAPPILYLLVGHIGGYLFILRCLGKQVKVAHRFNRVIEPEGGILSKTFSFFSSSSTNQYKLWQRVAVVKLAHVKHRLAYLLRNNLLVVMNSMVVPIDQLQKKYQLITSNDSKLKQNVMETISNCTYFVTKTYKMVRNSEGFILAFNSTVSCMVLTQERVMVGNFLGDILLFDIATTVCVQKIVTQSAIRSISLHLGHLFVCMQNDTAQIINLLNQSFINISGHKSFTSQAAMLDDRHVLISSFDGTLSLTMLPNINQWQKLVKRNGVFITSQNPKSVQIVEKFEVGRRETGVGNMILHKNTVLLSMLDNAIKLYRLSKIQQPQTNQPPQVTKQSESNGTKQTTPPKHQL